MNRRQAGETCIGETSTGIEAETAGSCCRRRLKRLPPAAEAATGGV